MMTVSIEFFFMSQIKVGLVSNKNADRNKTIIQALYKILEEKSIDIVLDGYAAQVLNQNPSSHQEIFSAEYIFTLGGDGTILRVARATKETTPKVIGVNLGKLGFLTELNTKDLAGAVNKVLKSDYVLDNRNLISVTVKRNQQIVKQYDALNEIAINQGLKARILRLELKTANQLIHNFEVDGLIISTPTGSTGHSLSAGGSIVSPDLNAFLITPICPLSLSNRPLIIADHHKLKVKVKTKRDPDSPVGLTIDGQVSLRLKQNDTIIIEKSSKVLQLVRIEKYNFFRHLRSKLKWGT